jgi:rubrerythrin
MDEEELDELTRRLLGPVRIVSLKDRLRSGTWKCTSCEYTRTSDTPILVPAPCPKCGGIAFETVEQPLL